MRSREGDLLARLGGDEFAALLVDSTLESARQAAERIRAATPARGAFSAGVAAWAPGESLEELGRRADLALYAAKEGGRDRVELAPEALGDAEEAAAGAAGPD